VRYAFFAAADRARRRARNIRQLLRPPSDRRRRCSVGFGNPGNGCLTHTPRYILHMTLTAAHPNRNHFLRQTTFDQLLDSHGDTLPIPPRASRHLSNPHPTCGLPGPALQPCQCGRASRLRTSTAIAAIAARRTSDRRNAFEAATAITTTKIKIRAVPLMAFGIACRPDSQNRLDWPIYSPCISSACPPAASRFPLVRIGITRSSTTAFRLLARRDGDRVRVITRGGYDWTKRFPWIAEAALKNRQKDFVIDGEAVILGVDAYSDGNACTVASTTRKFSTAPSTCVQWTAAICGICRSRCARPISSAS